MSETRTVICVPRTKVLETNHLVIWKGSLIESSIPQQYDNAPAPFVKLKDGVVADEGEPYFVYLHDNDLLRALERYDITHVVIELPLDEE